MILQDPMSTNVDNSDTVHGPHALLLGWYCEPCTVGLVKLGEESI